MQKRKLCEVFTRMKWDQMKRSSFLCVSSERSSRSSQNPSTSASSALLVRAQTWLTVILNCLLYKVEEKLLCTINPMAVQKSNTGQRAKGVNWLWNLCLKHSSNMENRTLLTLQQFPSSSQMESRISNSMLPGDYFIFTQG